MCRPRALMLGLLLALPLAHGNASTPAEPGTTPPRTTWMTVLLEGRKIGSLRIDRDYTNDRVTTTQTLSIELARVGHPLRLHSTSQTVESRQGEPLGFSATSALSEIDNAVEGHRIGERTFEVVSTTGGARQEHQVRLARDVLMFDAQRRAMMAAPKTPGSHYPLLQFDPSSQQVVHVDMEVIGDEPVPLPGGQMTLSHQRQHLLLPGGSQVMDLWLDDQGIARQGEFRLLGRSLRMIACDRQCAQAPVQPVDLFRTAMVESPRPLTANLRAAALIYRIHVSDGYGGRLIETDEQHVRPLDKDDFQLDIHRATPGGQAGPTAADTAPTLWLQSDAPAIRELAAKAVGDAHSDRKKMRRLRRFVSGYITQHGLGVGYASALEVQQNRKGDCTEFAVLLAAMARAEGIPARVVTGMVYADRYAGALRVFLPHAWVQSWVGGRWESYDAALRRFDATHIALATGDGDPASYFNATQLFGHLHIDRVATVDELFSPAAPSSSPAAPAPARAD